MLLGIRWGSLRTKIIAWSFVPTMIILVAVAVVILYAYQDVTEDLVIERNRELIYLTAGQFTAELKEYADLLDAEARTSAIYGNNPVAQRDALKAASNRLAVFDAGALILDTFGTVVAAEPERPEVLEQNWSDHTYYRQLLRSQISGSPGPVFSDIVADGPGGAEVIVVAVPIKGPQGGFMGAIAGMFRVRAATVSALYGDIVKLRIGESGSAYLVDGNDRVIYHSDPDRIGDDFSAQEVVQQVLSGEVNVARTRDLDGREIVASFAPVPGTSWGLVTQESWATLTGTSRGYGQFLLLLLALGVVVPALVVAVGVRWITRPITELIGAAQKVAKGDFGQTITARTGDEIEELAEQFNTMASALRESYADLEQKVAARTKELRESEERLRTVVTGAPIVLFALDAEGVFILSEGKGLDTLGLKPGQVVGQSAFDVYRDVPQIVENIHRAFAGEETTSTVEVDGLAFETRYSPLRGENGEVVGVIGVATDVTERKRAERALRESEERFQQVVENAQEWIWEVDTHGLYTYGSPIVEEILGYKPEEVVGKKLFYDLFHPEDREELKEAAFEAFAQKQSFREFINRNVRKDGETVWLSTSGVPILDEEGNLLGYRGADIDITERRRAEEALFQQTREVARMEERSRLARDLHDAVTQTLFSASLIAEALPTLWESDQDQGRQLLKQLRQLSRGALAEMRTLLLELRPAALVEAGLGDLLHYLAETATGRKDVPVTVKVEGECALPSDVHVALYRIAQEALNNVVKHADASQVTVSLRCSPPASGGDRGGDPPQAEGTPAGQGGSIKLCISDDGRGFDPSSVPPDRLGLSIMHERAQTIGATLRIESQPGHGTQVMVVWKG